MKAAIRICLVALLAALASAPARAQDTANTASIAPAVRSEVLDRYRVAVIRNGIVLTPRRGGTQAIEVTSDGIAIDGQPVSGGEVRDRLGADAALILQLSYASADELRQTFGPQQGLPGPGLPQPPAPPSAPGPRP